MLCRLRLATSFLYMLCPMGYQVPPGPWMPGVDTVALAINRRSLAAIKAFLFVDRELFCLRELRLRQPFLAAKLRRRLPYDLLLAIDFISYVFFFEWTIGYSSAYHMTGTVFAPDRW